MAGREDLIRAGLAYVDDQSQDEIRANRGTLTEPGKQQPVPRAHHRRRTSICSPA